MISFSHSERKMQKSYIKNAIKQLVRIRAIERPDRSRVEAIRELICFIEGGRFW